MRRLPWKLLPEDAGCGGIGGLKAGRRRGEGTAGHIKVQGHLHNTIVSVTSVSKERETCFHSNLSM